MSCTAAREVEGSSRGNGLTLSVLRKIEKRMVPFRCHQEMIRLASLLE